MTPWYVSDQTNWCSMLNHAIDDELVHDINPACIKVMNGCGNCEYSELSTSKKELVNPEKTLRKYGWG